jgi:hypothetical protein
MRKLPSTRFRHVRLQEVSHYNLDLPQRLPPDIRHEERLVLVRARHSRDRDERRGGTDARPGHIAVTELDPGSVRDFELELVLAHAGEPGYAEGAAVQ